MIHYHGTPLSGGISVNAKALMGKHAMISYANPEAVHIAAEVCQSFCLDNGAFSVWKRGAALDIDGYAEFVAHWMRHPAFDFYVIPDVIEGSLDDNRKLIATWAKTGIDMLRYGAPVWHMHEPVEVLRDYCNAYMRVCIGSSGAYSEVGTGRWWGRIAEAMDVACDDEGFPNSKLHGLRMLDPTIFSHLPLASADSTNVARNIGIDSAWKGTYTPQSREARAIILSERIEAHASAHRWVGWAGGAGKNFELLG